MSTSLRITAATAANESYLLPLAVMCRSLAATTPSEVCVDLKLLTTGLSSAFRKRLEHCLIGTRLELTEVIIDPAPLRGVKVNGHVSLETYFRLLAPSVLDGVGHLLYLDADLIVRHSIARLWSEPLNGAHLLAVPNACKLSAYFESERGVPAYRSLGIPGDAKTFNAGVMVLDSERWRETNTTQQILEYLVRFKEQVLWWDQDGLNAVLHAHWRPLPAKWNVMSNHFSRMQDWHDSVLDRQTFEAVKADPAIIHYSSRFKPWKPDYRGPFLNHWQKAFATVAPFLPANALNIPPVCPHYQIS